MFLPLRGWKPLKTMVANEKAPYRARWYRNKKKGVSQPNPTLPRTLFLRVCFLERKSQILKIGLGLFLVLRTRYHRHAEPEHVAKLFIRGFGEDGVLANAQGDIAHLVYGACRNTAEVLGSRECDVNEFVEKTVHPLATKGNLRANDIPLPRLVGSDGFFRATRRGLLAGNAREAGKHQFNFLFVFERTDADRYHRFSQARCLHGVGV